MRWPGFLNLRRLEGRIVALFLSLLLVVQLLSFGLIRNSIEGNAQASITAELRNGEKLLHRLLAQQAETRTDAARLLAADYGFLTTIATRSSAQDIETIKDALLNYGERIGVSVAAYTDPQFQLIAATHDNAGPFVQEAQRIIAAERALKAIPAAGASAPTAQPGPDRAQLVLIAGEPYQVVAVPVRAPQLVGWVLMGFRFGPEPLQDLAELSSLHSLVLTRAGNGDWRVALRALVQLDADPDLGRISTTEPSFSMMLGGEKQRARYVPLMQPRDGQDMALGAVLLRSFDEAVAPYRQLQLTLLALTAIGVAVFALGSVLFARRITGPITALSRSAERLGQGDYATPVRIEARDEVGDLALAFETMRQGIRNREEQVERLAYWDTLTGLPNREQFAQRLQRSLDSERDTGRACAVLMLDLDRFKHVNDVLGHHFGDRLLCGVASRLQRPAVCKEGFIARLGGDEFAVLLDGADLEQAVEVAQRILTAFEEPLTIDDNTVDLGAGIGIVGCPQHGHEVQLLLSRAELAMYTAKQKQSGTMVYHPGLDAHSQESLSLLSELRRAVEHNELRLYLQPKVDLHTGRILGAESLVRWQHPQRGLVPPMLFIPFAEQTGFIRTLTTWIIEQSARAWREMYAHGLDLRLSINLSTRDLLDQDLPAKLEQLIKTHDMNAQVLCLEITESAIMDDPQRAQQTLERLHELGFKLSIDDFGTGYSSLAYLKRLPVHELKIDKSFVMAMERDLDDAKIVRSTVDLAHNLGLRVVAEGIETAKAWKLLDALHCDEGQGYFIAKPMPEQEFVAWVQAWQAPVLDDETLESAFAKLA
ncbi:MAG: EAL domain-containing protein [Burkholderiaceae bacterium]|nr:EAL domain-containing protein [Burkholderiaceae bacterium]